MNLAIQVPWVAQATQSTNEEILIYGVENFLDLRDANLNQMLTICVPSV